jgi:hypothetical protein
MGARTDVLTQGEKRIVGGSGCWKSRVANRAQVLGLLYLVFDGKYKLEYS